MTAQHIMGRAFFKYTSKFGDIGDVLWFCGHWDHTQLQSLCRQQLC